MTGDSSPGVPRRAMLRAVFAAVAASAALVLYPIVRFLRPRIAEASGGAQEVVAPYRVSDLHPDAEGKWPSPFNFGGKPCLVVLDENGKVAAFNAVCTHLDCTVAYRPEQKDIFCNCHNGVYDLKGRNVSGPPPKPLTPYTVTLRGKDKEEIVVSRGS